MLNKILLVLSILALGGGSFLAYNNRAKFIETRRERLSVDKELRTFIEPEKGKVDEKIKEIGVEHGVWADAGKSKRDRGVELQNQQSSLSAKTTELENINKEIADKTAELEKWQTMIADAVGPGGLEGITQKIEELSRDITNLKSAQEAQENELKLAQKQVADSRASLTALQKTAAQRNRGITLNGLEGTVLAVNTDYGFAVINLGESKGLTADAKLIVKRGDTRIGMLSVSSISESKTIADIVGSSLAPGESIAPGDRVIVEKIQR